MAQSWRKRKEECEWTPETMDFQAASWAEVQSPAEWAKPGEAGEMEAASVGEMKVASVMRRVPGVEARWE